MTLGKLARLCAVCMLGMLFAAGAVNAAPINWGFQFEHELLQKEQELLRHQPIGGTGGQPPDGWPGGPVTGDLSCAANQESVNYGVGTLCYPRCPAGWYGAGPTCVQSCPAGYRDMGLTCHIDKALVVKGSWRCSAEKWGVCWWHVLDCPSGYTNGGALCFLNTPPVPAGWNFSPNVEGLDLAKRPIQGRGVGSAPVNCGPVAQKFKKPGRRAFYNFAHNPNEISNIDDALAAGANAFEPDIMHFDSGTVSLDGKEVNAHAGESGLFVYHDPVKLTSRMPDTLEAYLDHLHARAKGGANIAMIGLDIKSAAATQSMGRKMQEAVNKHLNYDGVTIPILYNFGDSDLAGLQGTSVFNDILDNLQPHEGIGSDCCHDFNGVYTALTGFASAHGANFKSRYGKSATTHVAYGTGNAVFGLTSQYADALGLAAKTRANSGVDKWFFLPWAFSVHDAAGITKWMDVGLDGVIADALIQPQDWRETLKHLCLTRNETIAHPTTYIATPADNPWEKPAP